MKSNYKQTFDAVNMPPDRQERIRSELSARIHQKHMEDNNMSIKSSSTKKLMVAAITIVIVLSLSTIVAVAYGSQIIHMLGGGQIESGMIEGGGHFVSMTSSEADPDPVEVKDGRVYFILDGSNTDITDYCTESTYFQYERIADNGYRHVFVIGGAPDNLGWAEYIWNADGDYFAANITFPPSVDDTDTDQPQWLALAEEELGTARPLRSHGLQQ